MAVEKNPIFNPEGDDAVNARTIVKGSTTGLFNLNATKYAWTKQMYQVMVGNFWIPEKVMGLKEDAIEFSTKLSKEEHRAYKGILSFLIFLDSMQTVNLPHLSDYVTAPEINLLIAIQTYQEAIHSQSYATILETVVDSKERNEIYYFWKTDPTLLERNKFIGQIYQNFIDEPSDKNFFDSMIANYLLEGIYFYNGFAFFDTLVDQGKMKATGRMIAYIRRDELTHVVMFGNMLQEIKKEFPDMYNEDRIVEMMKTAVDQEIEWSKHILGKGIPGMNEETIEGYTKWLANERLARIDIKPIYPEIAENPYAHLARIQDNEGDKSNFFETTVINYTQSTGLAGSWEDV